MTSSDNLILEADRAAAAPFLQQPRTQWWYALLMAAFFTALAAGPVLISRGLAASGLLLQAAAITAVATYYSRYRRRAGTTPRLLSAPREISMANLFLLAAGILAAAATVTAWMVGGALAGLSGLFLSTLAVVWLYERVVYPWAVRRVQRRLA